MMARKKRLRSLRLLASRHQRLHGFASQRSIPRRPCTGSASPQGNRSPSFKYFQTCYSKSFTKLASKFKISFLCTTAVIVVERIDVRNINVSIFKKKMLFSSHFSSKQCDLIHGECVQTYVPYLFLVIPLGPVTLTGQDYVLVESGCSCRPKYAPPGSEPNPTAIIPNF